MSEQQDNAGIVMHPPFFYLIAVGIAVGINMIVPLSFQLPEITGPAGICTLIIGILVFVASGSMFAKNKQSPSVHASQAKIITDGIYARTRNPIYLSAHLFLISAALYFDNIWMLLMVIPMTYVMVKFVIKKEENYLANKFGDEYVDYMKNVRRWI